MMPVAQTTCNNIIVNPALYNKTIRINSLVKIKGARSCIFKYLDRIN